MAIRQWIQVNNPDTEQWWINPDFITTIYQDTNSTNWVVCTGSGEDWAVPISSDAGKAITDMIAGKR